MDLDTLKKIIDLDIPNDPVQPGSVFRTTVDVELSPIESLSDGKAKIDRACLRLRKDIEDQIGKRATESLNIAVHIEWFLLDTWKKRFYICLVIEPELLNIRKAQLAV